MEDRRAPVDGNNTGDSSIQADSPVADDSALTRHRRVKAIWISAAVIAVLSVALVLVIVLDIYNNVTPTAVGAP